MKNNQNLSNEDKTLDPKFQSISNLISVAIQKRALITRVQTAIESAQMVLDYHIKNSDYDTCKIVAYALADAINHEVNLQIVNLDKCPVNDH